MAVLTVPARLRTTFHGISAAAGKVGACVAAVLWPLVTEVFGSAIGFAALVAVAVLGCIISYCLTEERALKHLAEEEDRLAAALRAMRGRT